MSEEKTTVTIPAKLYKKIENEVSDSEFKSVDEYIIKALEEKLPKDQAESLSADEEEKVKERLRALGYMD